MQINRFNATLIVWYNQFRTTVVLQIRNVNFFLLILYTVDNRKLTLILHVAVVNEMMQSDWQSDCEAEN